MHSSKSAGRFHRAEVCDSLGGEIPTRFDGRPDYLLEELSLVGSELFREDDAQRRRPGVRRTVQENLPRRYQGRRDVDMEFQVDLGKSGAADDIEQIAFGIVCDRALAAQLFGVRKLRGLPPVQKSQESILGP